MPSSKTRHQTPSPTWLRITLFGLVYGALQSAYIALRSNALDSLFIHWLTVQPAAHLVGWCFPDDHVMAEHHSLLWPAGRMSLRAGCDGFEVMTLFVAAMAVADVGLRRGLTGLLAGCALIWSLNQLRIVALYASTRYAPDWFDAIHTVWAPMLLIGSISAIYSLFVCGNAGFLRMGVRHRQQHPGEA